MGHLFAWSPHRGLIPPAPHSSSISRPRTVLLLPPWASLAPTLPAPLDWPTHVAEPAGERDLGPLCKPLPAGLTVAGTLPAAAAVTAASVQGRNHLMPGSQGQRHLPSSLSRVPAASPGSWAERLAWPIRSSRYASSHSPGGVLLKQDLTSELRTNPAFSSEKTFPASLLFFFFFPFLPSVPTSSPSLASLSRSDSS